jgi:hypothetical protein
MFSAKSSGSTHDSMAWNFSTFKRIEEGLLPIEYYLIGDEAFVNTAQFLVPWSGRGIGTWKDSFNFHLSSMRQCIERAFGLLAKRWGIFWRPLSCQFDKWSNIATVCAKLHNFFIDRNMPIVSRATCDVLPEDEWRIVDNVIPLPDGEIQERPSEDRRRIITSELERLGVRTRA